MKEGHGKRLFDLVAEYGMEGVVKALHDIAVKAKDDDSASILGSALEEFEELEDDLDNEDEDDETEDDEDEAEKVEDEEE